jgi:hypothetical protein
VATLLHNAGSLIVVFNSARLIRAGEELESTSKDRSAAGSFRRPVIGIFRS